MAFPTPYNRLKNFTQYALDHPTATYNPSDLDAELDAIELTLDSAVTNLNLIQRNDGKLANTTVHPDSLSTATLALLGAVWTPRGLWVTAHAYVVGDIVEQVGASYVCAVVHTSGTFATDHTAGKWIVLGGAISDAALVTYTPAGGPQAGIAQTVAAFLDKLIQSGTSVGAALIGFLQAGSSAVARSLLSKLREHVTFEDYGAVGDGATDDRAAIQAALDAVSALGGGTVYGTNGRTYLVRRKAGATKVFQGTYGGTWGYSLEIPNNVLIDLRGATVKATNWSGVDSEYVIFSNVSNLITPNTNSNLGIVNGIIDGASVNRNGAVWSNAFFGVRKLRLDKLEIKNCDNSSLFLEGCDELEIGTLKFRTGYGSSFRVGYDNSVDSQITDGGHIESVTVFDSHDHPSNPAGNPGNPVLFTGKNSSMGSWQAYNCSAGFKVFWGPGCQLSRALFDTGTMPNGGFKIQSSADWGAQRFTVGEIISKNCQENGLFVTFTRNVYIGSYLGIGNCQDGNSADMWLSGDDIYIGYARVIDSGSSAVLVTTNAQGTFIGMPRVTFGTLEIKNPLTLSGAGIGTFSVQNGYVKIDKLRIEDLRSTHLVQRYFTIGTNQGAGITINEFYGRGCAGNPSFLIQGGTPTLLDPQNCWVGRPDCDALTFPAGTLTISDPALGAAATFTSSLGGTFTAADVGKVIKSKLVNVPWSSGKEGVAQITGFTSGTVVTVSNLTAWPTGPMASGDWYIDRGTGGQGRVAPTAGATSTTVNDSNFVGTTSMGYPIVEVIPTNAAARALPARFGTFGGGTVTFDHAAAAGTETYSYRILGWTGRAP